VGRLAVAEVAGAHRRVHRAHLCPRAGRSARPSRSSEACATTSRTLWPTRFFFAGAPDPSRRSAQSATARDRSRTAAAVG
jgi:hypothetical protein